MLTKSKFKPAWWLRNAHLQTLWAARLHRAPKPEVRWERITTPDDDFLDLTWCGDNGGSVVVIFHGLTGSYQSPYARTILSVLRSHGYLPVVMHFRGCSGEPNKTRGAYHSGHTVDIEFVINTLKQRFPQRRIFAIGYSLGGNALLKYLATAENIPLHYAISVCPPLNLAEGAARINQGFSKLYQHTLIKQMKAALRAKQQRYPNLGMDQFNFESIDDFETWDDQVTAPLHGFASGEDYYRRASTLNDLTEITTETHIVFSQHGPFFTERCIPTSALPRNVTFELVAGAGHVGFIAGRIPGVSVDWLRHRLLQLVQLHDHSRTTTQN